MIGSKILYRHYPKYGPNKYEAQQYEGLVVDAFTNVSGTTKGDVFLGFGDVNGDVKSRRMYKVQYHDSLGFQYENISDSQLIKILEFKSALDQEIEKYV